MHSVGEILKQARLKKKLTLDDVEKATKIRKKFLAALEANAFDRLPGTAYIIGFLKNYSRYLSLDHTVMLALFRREFDDRRGTQILPTGITHPVDQPQFVMTPKLLAILTAVIVFMVFLGYLLVGYRFAVSAPTIIIESPQNNLVVSDDRVMIRGRTDPEATVTINGGEVTVQVDGSFSQDVSLPFGTNTFTVTATNKLGKKSTTIVVVERTR